MGWRGGTGGVWWGVSVAWHVCVRCGGVGWGGAPKLVAAWWCAARRGVARTCAADHVLMAGSALVLLIDSCRGRLGLLREAPLFPALTALTADVTLLTGVRFIGARFGLAAPSLEGELLGWPDWSSRSLLCAAVPLLLLGVATFRHRTRVRARANGTTAI